MQEQLIVLGLASGVSMLGCTVVSSILANFPRLVHLIRVLTTVETGIRLGRTIDDTNPEAIS